MVKVHLRSRGKIEKKKFQTFESATSAAKGLRYICYKKLIPYLCPECNHYHLTWKSKLEKLKL